MKIVQAIIATTHIDRHGDRLTKGALEGMADQAREAFILMTFNHDPRVPPIGRSVAAEVIEIEGGEQAVVMTNEVFEPGDSPPLDTSRQLRLREFDAPTILFDRSYMAAEDERDLKELAGYFDVHADEKKSVEPLGLLILALGGAAAAFASGFLGKMGSDSWDLLKSKLGSMLERRRATLPEFVFILEIQLERASGPLNIQCILSSPTSKDLTNFLDRDSERLWRSLDSFSSVGPEIRKIALHYEKGEFSPGYAVRADGFPLPLHLPTEVRDDEE